MEGKNVSMGICLVILFLCMICVENPVPSSNEKVYHCDLCDDEGSYIFMYYMSCRGQHDDDVEGFKDCWMTVERMINNWMSHKHTGGSIRSVKELGMQGKQSALYRKQSSDVSRTHSDEKDVKHSLGVMKMVIRPFLEKIPLSCRQSALVNNFPYGMTNPHSIHSPLSSNISITVTTPVHMVTEFLVALSDISSSYPRKNGPHLKNTIANVKFGGPNLKTDTVSKPEGRNLQNNTVSKVKHGCAKPANKSAGSFDMPDGKDFPHFPFWSKLFSGNVVFNQASNDNGSPNNGVLMWYLVYITCTLHLFLSMLLVWFGRRDETKKVEDNTVFLRFFTRSFFLKWHWNRLQSDDSRPSVAGKLKYRCTDRQSMEQTSPKSFCGKNTVTDLLNEYVFRPWLLKSETRNTVSCPEHCKSTDCRYVGEAMCLRCHHYVNSFPNRILTIHVNPATRFLSYPTYNPDIDFAHVGYRLATLGSLPSSVPVSRVKLADAGFYFRGQNAEVMCYSCHVRFSDWSRREDPMDIHRQLSPHCEHVMHRDRELAALTSRNSRRTDTTALTSGDSRQTDTNAANSDISQISAHNDTPANDHTEDGELPETQTGESQSVRRKIASSPNSSAVTILSSAKGQNISTATITPTVGRVLHEYGPHAANSLSEIKHSDNVRRQTETSIPSMVTNGVTETRNAQSSGMSSTNMSPSTNASSTVSNSDISPVVPTTSTSTRTGSGETGNVDSDRTDSANLNTSADGSSASGGSQHLYPQARLDLGGAVYPMYQDMASRRRSFTSPWDDSRAPPLNQVILCGMFYGGYADCVRCFYCGVGLKQWAVTDDVWTEHVRWRPGCGYLRAVKGDDFIRNIQRRLGLQTPGSENNQQAALGSGPTSSAPQNSSSQSTANQATPATTSAQVPPRTTTSAMTTAATSSASVSATGSRLAPSNPEAVVTTSRGSQSERAGAVSATVPLSSSGLSAASSSVQGEGRRSVGGTRGQGGRSGVAGNVQSPSDRAGLAQLQEENRQLSQRFRCRACERAQIDTILMPCGHLTLCGACASTVTSCPLCQASIRATAHVYLSN